MDYLIFDLVIAAVLLICAIHGAWRGLVLSLCGLLAAVVAFAGAGFAAKTLSPPPSSSVWRRSSPERSPPSRTPPLPRLRRRFRSPGYWRPCGIWGCIRT